MPTLTIEGHRITVPDGTSILDAARKAGVYIPVLCHHPDLPPAQDSPPAGAVFQGGRRIENAQPQATAEGCGLCVVEIAGMTAPVRSCCTPAADGMRVVAGSPRLDRHRRRRLVPILGRHPHACLTCDQQAGCSRLQCPLNVPENERCCEAFGNCELQNLVHYIGIAPETPAWRPPSHQPLADGPLVQWDFSRCIGCTRCVRVCRDVVGAAALGYVHDANGRVQVGAIRPDLVQSGCRFCAACAAVCPAGALVDKTQGVPGVPDDPVPCRTACPIGVDVPAYIRCIARGKPEHSLAIVRQKTPFPGILGRVCRHPCEDACRRSALDEAVAVCALKRFAADAAVHVTHPRFPEAATGKRIAVVGAGPAGLTAAYFLRCKGHGVTLFEAHAKAGGMLRCAIPPFRLPVSVLEQEITPVLEMGVDFLPGRRLGRDFSLQDLQSAGYAAIFLALGAQMSRRFPIEGADGAPVLDGLRFLGRAAAGASPPLKRRVVVVGGGNVAVDAALTARRMGASAVWIVCLEAEGQMPAGRTELEIARAEGIHLASACAPVRVRTTAGRDLSIDLVACTRVLDAHGRFAPRFNHHRRKRLAADQIIMAMGQMPDVDFLVGEGHAALVGEDGRLVVDPQTLCTALPNLFAGGDLVRDKGSVIDAIADGRRAAAAIDRHLGGSGVVDAPMPPAGASLNRRGMPASFVDGPSAGLQRCAPTARGDECDEMFPGIDRRLARREAGRCLQCDLRTHIRSNPAPPDPIQPFVSRTLDEDLEDLY